MNLHQVVEKLEKEINTKNRKESIQTLEEFLIDNFEQLPETPSFFQLPLQVILEVISQKDLSEIEENVSLILNIITNTIKSHNEEKGTILLLEALQTRNCNFSIEECISILSCFKDCDILNKFNNLYQEKLSLPNIDYDFELQKKDELILKLNTENEILTRKKRAKEEQKRKELEKKKQEQYEEELFVACANGNLERIKNYIEKEGGNKEMRNNYQFREYNENYYNDTFLNIAARKGHINIMKYLIEEQKVDKEIRGFRKMTPFHGACEYGKLKAAQYLYSLGVDIEAVDDNGWTPLHVAVLSGSLPVVKYLVSLGVNLNPIDKEDGYTPMHIAAWKSKNDIGAYLNSIGADKTIKDKYGRTPSRRVPPFTDAYTRRLYE